MELELWADLSQAICDVRRGLAPRPRDTHPTATIVRVHLWAALHDRPTAWACDPDNWTAKTRPAAGLPDQSTMSRRTRRADFDAFLALLQMRLRGRPAGGRVLAGGGGGGKPLELPHPTPHPHPPRGRGAARAGRRDKLHTLLGGGLAALPPWVRRPWRVRRWVSAKLLVNAARIRRLNRRRREVTGEGKAIDA